MWVYIVVVIVLLLALAPGVNQSSGVLRLARAIARAEGYGRPGVIPTVRNNPGDLTDPATGEIRTFATPEDGWSALYHQIELMLSGASSHYHADMSIWEVSRIYTATEQDAWAANVASFLGVSPDTTLRQIAG